MQKVITHPEVGEVTLSQTRRSTRISLTVRPNGSVRLSFPPRVTQRRALRFLDEKVDWIALSRRKMAEKYPEYANFGHENSRFGSKWGADANFGKKNSNFGSPSGETDRNVTGTQHEEAATGMWREETTLEREARLAARKRSLRRAVEALRAEAKELLPPMVVRLAAEHGFRHGAVRVKFTRSRWGSCTARNDINLSIALAALPRYLAEYVVLHELCHTVHKNHSARFHALLDRVTNGQSAALNKELKKYRPDITAAMHPR